MAPGETPSSPRAKSFAAILLLSLLWATSNLRPDLLPDLIPESLPYFASHAFPLILLAAVSYTFIRQRKGNLPSPIPIQAQILPGILIGIALFVVPAVVAWFAKSSEPNSARTALFCLVPVFTIVFQPYLGSARTPNNHALLAALIAFLGALCILPLDYPRSPQALLAFAALILAVAGVGAANCLAEAAANSATQTQAGFSLTTAIAASTAAILLAAASAIFDREAWLTMAQRGSHFSLATSLLPALLWSLLLDLPALILLFWSIKRFSSIRLSTRYLLAPLLTILVGIAFLRAERAIQPRTWAGLLFIACGSAYLLFAPEADASPTTIFSSNQTD